MFAQSNKMHKVQDTTFIVRHQHAKQFKYGYTKVNKKKEKSIKNCIKVDIPNDNGSSDSKNDNDNNGIHNDNDNNNNDIITITVW